MTFLKGCYSILLFGVLTFYFAQDKPTVDLGGALRFNYVYSDWKEGQKKRGGDFGYDVFRVNAKAAYKGVKLNAEYRLYSQGFGGGMLKQGWVGYDFNEKNNLQIGLTQVPFGNTTYNSHSWFFSLNYYVGLEDDHDMGVKFSHEDKKWDYYLAFFKNAEELRYGSNSDISPNRYSYDVSSINIDGEEVLRNKEVNQLNGKVNYKFGEKTQQKIGVSGEYGGLYNLDTEKMGNHYAAALHYMLKAGKFDMMAEIAHYQFNPKEPEGQPSNEIAMAAYGAPYLVASKATLYTVSAGYDVGVEWGPISNIKFYNDFGYMDKSEKNFEDSFMNVTGALVSAGNVYTYIDFAAGKDQPWLGPNWTNGLAKGDSNAKWHYRFNINLGYYF